MAQADQAVERIKAKILEGVLLPGERLPPEDKLAKRLGTSRNAMREAVRALVALKILDVRQGDGTYVTDLDPAQLLGPLAFAASVGQTKTVLEFLEARRLIEPQAAALAAARMSPGDKRALDRLLDQVSPTSEVEEFVSNDLEFHHRIAVGAGNDVLTALLDNIAAPTQRARVWRGQADLSAVPKTLAEHRHISAAIAAADADLARSLAEAHVAATQLYVRTNLADTTATHAVLHNPEHATSPS